jgi:transposase
MKKDQTIIQKSLIVTVDIGKDINVGYYRFPDGQDVKPFEFRNTREDFDRFWDRIDRASKSSNLKSIIVGFEPTGAYGIPLLHYMRTKPVEVVQINPLHTKKMKAVVDNTPNKTDQKDPRILADIIQLGRSLSWIVPTGNSAQLRAFVEARERSIKRRTSLLNQLQDIIYVIFPEFSKTIKDFQTKSAQYILKNYPTPQHIVDMGVEGLAQALTKISRGRFSIKQAQSLFESAKNSVGIHEGVDSMVIEISEILFLIDRCNEFIDKSEKKLSEIVNQISYSKYILSIKGISIITTAVLIGEAGDFNNFKNLSEIMKLAGLNIYEISSGKRKGQRHISKMGRPLMRKALYFAALNMVRKGGNLHEYYQNCIKRGMNKMKAMTAVTRKLLKIIFALVRDQVYFVHSYSK